MSLLAARLGYACLAEPVRFRNQWEQQASLRLRDGDTSVLATYDQHGRIHGGDPVLPGAQDPHLGGVHDADEEPGISGGVVGKVPVHMGEVPDSRQILGGDCCLRAGASRERRGRLSRPGPWSAAGRGSAR